jgi:hypothetical protein
MMLNDKVISIELWKLTIPTYEKNSLQIVMPNIYIVHWGMQIFNAFANTKFNL